MICKRIFLFCLILMSGLSVKSQISNGLISGNVLEAGTEKPIANVSIYFDGTMNGVTTDKEGSFTVYPRTNNKVPIIISAIGYQTETVTDYSAGKKLIIYLKEKTYDLEAVTISANDGMSRQEKLRIFRREFLGTSSDAKNCEILNEGDIRFTFNKKTGTVKAFCDVPIIIQNKNLGYTLNYLLQSFTHTDWSTSFFGTQFFRDDLGKAENQTIQKARQNSYLGSQMHFIRSLWNNDLKANGFEVFKHNSKVRLNYDSLVVAEGAQKYLRLKGQIDILYRRKVSSVYHTEKKDIFIEKDGNNDPVGIAWEGVIAAQRAGDLLPLEYGNTPGLSVGLTSKAVIGSADTLKKSAAASGINAIIAAADTIRNRMPAEKLYIHFDKPYYSTGDTIWMKAYLFDADFLRASEKSGIVYIELANDTNKVLLQRMMPIKGGLGAGNIVLDADDIPEGSYTIRAYTNLMRNFGEDLVFKKNFYISGRATRAWLVNFKPSLSTDAGKDNVRLALQFNQFDKKYLALRDLDFRVLAKQRVLLRDKVQTDIEGKLDVNFNLPEKTDVKNISIVASDPKDATRKMTIPVVINRPENTDIQFMPEGGNLVAGISSVVAFKAIGEDGKGVQVSGKILNGSIEVATFSSSFRGMGTFELKPIDGGIYTAKVVVNGVERSFNLPVVKSAGSGIKVTNAAESDSVDVLISSTLPGTYYLIAQSRGVICYGAMVRLTGNNSIKKSVAKELFPTGVARLSLLNAEKQPLNERIAFIDHHDNLKIAVQPEKGSYTTRDSIALNIEVKDHEGRPIQGSFSIAVTDDSQVRTDSLESNILTSMLLSSDLKGTIEEPGHYFEYTKQSAMDLELLLLTQGWVGYDPITLATKEGPVHPAVPQFAAEPEFTVRGRVSNVFNKSSASTGIRLLSLNPMIIRDTLTNEDGSFAFSGFPPTDSLTLVLQARNKNGKSFNIGMDIEEFKPPVFKIDSKRYLPWYVNSDNSMIKYMVTAMDQRREQLDLPKGTNMLEEVNITRKKIVKGSKNLNGEGGADVILDETDIRKASSMTLFELLQKRFNVKKQFVRNNREDGEPIYRYLYGDLNIQLVLDGWDSMTKPKTYDLSEDFYMNYLKAEDITGIEIMSSDRFAFAYDPNITLERMMSKMFTVPVFFEVTTRSGKGPFMRKIQGTNMYKPMPFTGMKTFYSPKYSINAKANGKDQRSTIHWEPDIVTDSSGKTAVSFFSADNPGTYSIIIEGSDMNGNVGRQTGKITIK